MERKYYYQMYAETKDGQVYVDCKIYPNTNIYIYEMKKPLLKYLAETYDVCEEEIIRTGFNKLEVA